ncbi:MAG TPA: apolipoprotein N-acyltransferase [Geminicoccaceae bacterium]|nr:apolipoprotein N-acyltransferase [Geminicoccus sp.]HMU48695.1 apolipoprotein N-acyltransferase [Geminicoccaceae bacterium]
MLAAAALPPIHALPALLAFAVLLLLVRRTPSRPGAFLVGWGFGFGWFLAGLYWVGIAFYADAERFGSLAVPAVLALAAFLAILPGLACLAVSWRRWTSVRAQALALAVAWIVTEIARGGLGLRFPWNPVAIVWAGSDAMLQSVAWIGQWGLGLVTVAAATLFAAVVDGHGARRWIFPGIGVAVLGLLLGAGVFRLSGSHDLAAQPVDLRIVQANISQDMKWADARRAEWLRRHLELTVRPETAEPDAVIWPETAVPYQLERDANARAALASVAPSGGYVLAGGNRYDLDLEPPTANNSLFAVDGEGRIDGRYDKVDLVPFGEFLPFRPVLSLIGLRKVTEGTLDFVAGPGRVTMALPGLPSFSPLICYEAIFPTDAAPLDPRPSWLLNVTNDAWFGKSSGPYQHLAMARLRAIEEGLPLVRAANTGVSAVIDAYGRVAASLPLGQAGVLDTSLPGALAAAPPIRRWHALITVGLMLLTIGTSLWVERRANWQAQHSRYSGLWR